MSRRKVEGAFLAINLPGGIERIPLNTDRVRFPFALTKTSETKRWAITHIPTGMSFYNNIHSRTVGRRLFKDFLWFYPEFFTKGNEPGKDWVFGTRPTGHPDYEKMHKAYKWLKDHQAYSEKKAMNEDNPNEIPLPSR